MAIGYPKYQLDKKIISATLIAVVLLTSYITKAANQSNSENSPGGLSIEIEASRQRLAVGTSFDIRGTLTNNTKSTLWVNEKYLVLKVPGEIEGPRSSNDSTWYGYLPVARHTIQVDGKEKDITYAATLALEPGQSTPVFWKVDPQDIYGGQNDAQGSQSTGVRQYKASFLDATKFLSREVSIELYYLFFAPGDYQLTVTAAYWKKNDISKPPDIVSVNKTLNVAAPQFVILFGASVGGLIAYIILPQARRQKLVPTNIARISYHAVSIVGAMLLSSIVTILLSRISESQFLIRVTVSDLWGAIAIGFVANYLGIGILSKMIKQPVSSQEQQPGAPSQAVNPTNKEQSSKQANKKKYKAKSKSK